MKMMTPQIVMPKILLNDGNRLLKIQKPQAIRARSSCLPARFQNQNEDITDMFTFICVQDASTYCQMNFQVAMELVKTVPLLLFLPKNGDSRV